MADFKVPGGGPADADGHVHIGADGRIRVSKSLHKDGSGSWTTHDDGQPI